MGEIKGEAAAEEAVVVHPLASVSLLAVPPTLPTDSEASSPVRARRWGPSSCRSGVRTSFSNESVKSSKRGRLAALPERGPDRAGEVAPSKSPVFFQIDTYHVEDTRLE